MSTNRLRDWTNKRSMSQGEYKEHKGGKVAHIAKSRCLTTFRKHRGTACGYVCFISTSIPLKGLLDVERLKDQWGLNNTQTETS